MALTYATVAQWRSYSDLVGGADADLEKVLLRAERDVDSVLGPWAVRISGLKYDPLILTTAQRTALQNAACAQAEYRRQLGEEWVGGGGDYYEIVRGPDFQTEGGPRPRISPEVHRELRGTGLVKVFARVG